MKKQTKILLTILFVLFIGVFVFSGIKLYSIIHEYRVDRQMYNGLSGQYVTNAGERRGRSGQRRAQRSLPHLRGF